MGIRIPLAVIVVRRGNATQVAAPGARYEGVSLGLWPKKVRRVRTCTGIARVEISYQYDKEDDCKWDHRYPQTPHDQLMSLSGRDDRVEHDGKDQTHEQTTQVGKVVNAGDEPDTD